MVGEIKVEGKNVLFQLHGIDRILAIKSSLKVPVEHIIDVSTERADWQAFKQLKLAGSNIPGVVKDGRYYSPKDGWLFYEMHDPDKCVTVTLKDEKYNRIIFEVQDKEESANKLRKLIQS